MPANDIETYVAPTVPEEERLVNYRALGVGLHATLSAFLGRVRQYHDLLELELEDAPGGEVYLKEANEALDLASSILTAYGEAHPLVEEDFESFDLAMLVRGLAERINKSEMGKLELIFEELADNEAFIRGRLFECQQLLFDLTRLVAPESATGALWLRLRAERLEESFFINRRSKLSGGDYLSVAVGPMPELPPIKDMAGLSERLTGEGKLPSPGRLLFVRGVVMEHGGMLLAPPARKPLNALSMLLPAQRNRVSMYHEAGFEGDGVEGGATILLVDDEAIIWDVVIDMLQGMGYTVILAADGQDCIDIYRENPGEIDLVLLDMVMPKVTGKEAFFALKEIDPQVSVLLQSGYIQEEEARDVLEAGAKGFLRKPYRMRQLAKAIREALHH